MKNTSLPDKILNHELFINQLWENSCNGIALIDKQGKIIAINNTFCELVKLERSKLLQLHFTTIYHQNKRNYILQNFLMDLENNTLKTNYEYSQTLWNNEPICFEIKNLILSVPDDDKIVLSIFRDMTMQKKNESILEKSEQHFRMLFNNASDLVFVNPITKENTFGFFSEISYAACQKLRYSKEELLNLSIYDIIPARHEEHIDLLIKNLKNDKRVLFKIDFMTKDRRKILVEISSHLFELNGEKTVISIARDITQHEHTEKRLRNSSEQLRSLASRLQTIREEERSMIAREIHDELGQLLTVLKIKTALLGKKLPESGDDYLLKINNLISLIDQATGSVQKIAAKLRPGILDEIGLIAAIEWQAQEFQRNTGIRCNYTLPEESLLLDKPRATAIFRILQEALTNVARHAFAKQVSIYFKKENENLILEVTDNGTGIRKSQIDNPKSLGLLGIRERVLAFGGKVSINGVEGEGTNLRIDIPFENNKN
jgi:PAS domain S-box-containing protein